MADFRRFRPAMTRIRTIRAPGSRAIAARVDVLLVVRPLHFESLLESYDDASAAGRFRQRGSRNRCAERVLEKRAFSG